MSKIPPVTPPQAAVPVHAPVHKRPPPPPSSSIARDPPYQGNPPRVGFGVSVKI